MDIVSITFVSDINLVVHAVMERKGATMPATKYDLKNNRRIEQGSSYWWSLMWKDSAEDVNGKNLLQWAARMQIREFKDSPTALVSLTSDPGGGITLGDGAGESNILVYIEPDETDLLTASTAVYDLEMVDPGDDVFRLLEGEVAISLNVTR